MSIKKKVNSKNNIRKQLQSKYYDDWSGSRLAFDELTKIERIKMYNAYIDKIEQFIDEIDLMIDNGVITKEDFKPNNRQQGGYRRCMQSEPSGWGTKHAQFGQRYKELMVDYLYYSDDTEYDDMSIKELQQMRKMASYLYELALNNKEDLENQDDPDYFSNKIKIRGYLTKRPEVKKFESGNMCSSFILAVMRDYKNKEGKYDFDYICVICWNDIAKESLKYFADDFVEIEGRLQTRSYVSEDGQKRFVTEVYCTDINSKRRIKDEMTNSTIELSRGNIHNVKYEDIIAVTVAEGGAMGEANGFYAMDKSFNLFHLNFGTTDITERKLHETFPLLEKFTCFFEEVGNLDKGWGWFNMGFGNYLLVRDIIYNEVKEYIDDNLEADYEHGDLYNRWYDVIKRVYNDVCVEEEYDPENEYAFREMTIEKIGEINLTKNILAKLDEDNILFIETANDGTTYLMDDKKKLYYVQLEYDKEINKEAFAKVFTKYAKTNVDNTKYYKAINLGLGHALLIKTDIYDDYMILLRENIVYENEFEDCYTAYCHWMDCALKFINNK